MPKFCLKFREKYFFTNPGRGRQYSIKVPRKCKNILNFEACTTVYDGRKKLIFVKVCNGRMTYGVFTFLRSRILYTCEVAFFETLLFESMPQYMTGVWRCFGRSKIIATFTEYTMFLRRFLTLATVLFQ